MVLARRRKQAILLGAVLLLTWSSLMWLQPFVTQSEIVSATMISMSSTVQRETTNVSNSALAVLHRSAYIEANLLPGRIRNVGSMPPSRRVAGNERKMVVLVTNQRSGSSFVGNLFNLNKDVFYFFEPFWPRVDLFNHSWNQEDARRVSILQTFSTCNFHTEFGQSLLKNVSTGKMQWLRAGSQVLTQSCRGIWLRGPQRRCLVCHPLDPSTVTTVCLSRKVFVAKVIRLSNMKILEHVYEDWMVGNDVAALKGAHQPATLHVLHLVRDPRGTIHSRMHLSKRRFHEEYLQFHPGVTKESFPPMEDLIGFSAWRLCGEIMHGIKLVATRPDWIREKYVRVRFEDIALNPRRETKRLYDLYNLNFTENIAKWINSNTNYSGNDLKSRLYSMKRNSSHVTQSWMKMMSSDKEREYVRIIEENCNEAMFYLGYKPVIVTEYSPGLVVSKREVDGDYDTGQREVIGLQEGSPQDIYPHVI